MSRYHALAATGLQADFGWDKPLETYWAQVYRTAPHEDMVLWVGTGRGEIGSVLDLARQLAAHGFELGIALRAQLAADRHERVARPQPEIATVYEPDGRGPIRQTLTGAFGLPNLDPLPDTPIEAALSNPWERLTFVDDDRDGAPVVHYQPVRTRRLLPAPDCGMDALAAPIGASIER